MGALDIAGPIVGVLVVGLPLYAAIQLIWETITETRKPKVR